MIPLTQKNQGPQASMLTILGASGPRGIKFGGLKAPNDCILEAGQACEPYIDALVI